MMKLKAFALLLLMFAFETSVIAQTPDAPLSLRSAGTSAVDAGSTSSWPQPTLLDATPTDGDPIDLYSGLYVRTTADLAIDDTIHISLERTYRNGDHFSRSFGVGTSHPYDMFIAGDGVTFSGVDLIMADGAPIHFERISPGTGYADAVFEHTSTPTSFYGARINWNGSGWTVMLRDGSYYKMRGCTPKAKSPGECGVIEYRDRDGQILHINRDAKGNITRIVSPRREWIAFTYDEYDRVTRAAASTGAFVTYKYDDKGRLVSVRPSGEAAFRYEYDDEDRMTVIFDHGQVIHNSYRQEYCVYQLWQLENQHAEFRFNYVFDEQGRHIATEVRTSDNSLRRVTFNPSGLILTDTRHVGQPDQASLIYDRDPRSNRLQKVTVDCASREKPIMSTNLIDPLQAGERLENYDQLLMLCASPAVVLSQPQQ